MKKLIIQLLTLLAVSTANAQNPYLPLWEHVPDGEPRVFEDPDNPGKMRAYIIGSHDTHFIQYCGNDIRMWSAPVKMTWDKKPVSKGGKVVITGEVTARAADGRRLALPADPIRTTNANGYTDLTHYQVYAPLKDGSQLKVQADVPGVEITVSPVVEGRATIKCVYQGKEKTFLVN